MSIEQTDLTPYMAELKRITKTLASVTKERDQLKAEAAERRRLKSVDPLAALANKLAPGSPLERACVRLAEHHSGYPSGGSGGTNGTGDRTGLHAQRRVDGQRGATDTNGNPLGRVEVTDTAYSDALKLLTRVDEMVRKALPSKLTADHAASSTKDAEGCRSCRRVIQGNGHPAWGDIHRNGLCMSCTRHISRVAGLYEWEGDMPPLAVTEAFHRKGKLDTGDIHQAMHGKKRRQ